MNLPDLAWQAVYGSIAWGLVLAAVVVALVVARVARDRPLSRSALVLIGLACLGLQALPGALAPAHWLGLAFQWPSALLLGLCLLSLLARWNPTLATPPLMPVALAQGLALGGGLLYLDASGWTAFGLYAQGFGPRGAPLLALALSAVCAWALVRGRWPAHAAVLLAALTLFTVARLPTGNLWDALLDPFLWFWACGVTLHQAYRHLRHRRQHPARV